jgi:hypothetical protein
MKIINAIKTLLLTGVITILTVIPVMAQDINMQQIQDKKIIGVYTESNKDFYCEQGDVITEYEDNSYYINSNVNIYSIDKLDNTITVVNNSNELYSFYAEDINKYYLNEQLNITIDQDENIIEYVVDNEPQVYNTEITKIEGNTAILLANGNKYTFENEEGSDGWKTGEKCKAVIQDGRLIEVRPIPLNER